MSLINSTLPAQESVVLLHGLARSPQSMHKMELALNDAGYAVHNIGYNSRHHSIEQLAETVGQDIRAVTQSTTRIHIVTHSLGSIIVRQIQASAPLPKLGRVVMLSPPNEGSEVVDTIGDTWIFRKVNGPAGQQLGTHSDSFVNQLPPIDFECGVITGDRSFNWINSLMIPGKDDGKVSIKSAEVDGLTDFKVIHVTHAFIMKKKAVIEDVIHFLKNGTFASRDD